MDGENEVSKMFIISLEHWIELESTSQSQAVYTLEYRPLKQQITVHIGPDRDIINDIIVQFHKWWW